MVRPRLRRAVTEVTRRRIGRPDVPGTVEHRVVGPSDTHLGDERFIPCPSGDDQREAARSCAATGQGGDRRDSHPKSRRHDGGDHHARRLGRVGRRSADVDRRLGGHTQLDPVGPHLQRADRADLPTFPSPPRFPSFPSATPAPPPIDTSTNGTTSIVTELAPGGEENDGAFDINEFDYHLTALLLQRVLAADPHGPVSILADGTRRATFFQPDDEAWVLLARKLSGRALPLPSAATEQATYTYFTGLGTARLEKILSYLIIQGTTLTGAMLGPVSVSQATYTTANGQTLLVKSDFGVVTLVDNSPLTQDSGIVEAPMTRATDRSPGAPTSCCRRRSEPQPGRSGGRGDVRPRHRGDRASAGTTAPPASLDQGAKGSGRDPVEQAGDQIDEERPLTGRVDRDRREHLRHHQPAECGPQQFSDDDVLTPGVRFDHRSGWCSAPACPAPCPPGRRPGPGPGRIGPR